MEYKGFGVLFSLATQIVRQLQSKRWSRLMGFRTAQRECDAVAGGLLPHGIRTLKKWTR
jgi:hypothetical protein